MYLRGVVRIILMCPFSLTASLFIMTRRSYHQKINAPCGALNTWLNSVRLQNIRVYVFGNLEISSGLNAHCPLCKPFWYAPLTPSQRIYFKQFLWLYCHGAFFGIKYAQNNCLSYWCFSHWYDYGSRVCWKCSRVITKLLFTFITFQELVQNSAKAYCLGRT